MLRRALPHPRLALLPLTLLALAAPAQARDRLGVFGAWGAFRDSAVPRCYAIALAQPGHVPRGAYIDVATWPGREVRGQVHLRLPETPHGAATLSLGGQHFTLTGGGQDLWAGDARQDAAIIAALRSASGITLTTRNTGGRTRVFSWDASGAASAMDAATLGCAQWH